MITFDSNCLYIIQCLALVFLAAPCVLFAGGMLIFSFIVLFVLSILNHRSGRSKA